MTLLSMLFIGLVVGGALVLTISRAPAYFRAVSARAGATKHQQTLANINRLELDLGLVEPPNAALPRPKLLPPPAASVQKPEPAIGWSPGTMGLEHKTVYDWKQDEYVLVTRNRETGVHVTHRISGAIMNHKMPPIPRAQPQKFWR